MRGMAHLSHTLWSGSRKGSGGFISFLDINGNIDDEDRQINMDYSICQALKRFPRHQRALVIYDICCQWIIHFRERVSESEFLELQDSMEITGAVGKWHLAAHIPECFPKFTLNFVEGAGEVEGEILETLWSGLDEIAAMAQAMSVAHHQEVIDDHMNDSNWCKIIRIGECLYYECHAM